MTELKRDLMLGFTIVLIIILLISIIFGIGFLIVKVIGIILIIGAIFMMFSFPDIDIYQDPEMGETGVFIGIVLLIIGIVLLFI
jgi:hypothetical protein